jgi:hypothetical protein
VPSLGNSLNFIKVVVLRSGSYHQELSPFIKGIGIQTSLGRLSDVEISLSKVLVSGCGMGARRTLGKTFRVGTIFTR